jgi:hypothetical protein
MWYDAYILCSAVSLVHMSDYSFSGSLNYSSISWDVTLGENCETNRNLVFTHFDIVANQEFLTPVIGVLWYYSVWGWEERLPSQTHAASSLWQQRIHQQHSQRAQCQIASLGTMSLLRTATIDTEPPAFLVLLTVCSCCMSQFRNTMSLYNMVTDGEGSDPQQSHLCGPDMPARRLCTS